MIKYLKTQERYLQRSADELKEHFLKPVYHQVEGVTILLGYFWRYPEAEAIWFRTIQMLNDVRMEIVAKENRGGMGK